MTGRKDGNTKFKPSPADAWQARGALVKTLTYERCKLKTFYLQKDKSGRVFIDESLHTDNELLNTTEAETWKMAKAWFAEQ